MTRILVMKTLSLSEAKAKLSGLVDAVERRDEEVVITRNGRPAAVLVSADEYESWKETQGIQADNDLMAQIRKSLRELKTGKAKLYTLDELFK
jgi:antitoxin YefM